jgi:hypothetical protein
MIATERRAELGELCTCGRQALIVYLTEAHGAVGYCGLADGGGTPIVPCPWCGAGPHLAESAKCPAYQVRPPAQVRTAPAEPTLNEINHFGQSVRVALAECADCGHDFDPDTSPNLILCWVCDEADAQAGDRR